MATVRISDVYKPSARQKLFHACTALFRLYGGAKGGGKSVALLWEAIDWCLKVPGCNVLLLRRTYPELKQGLIDHFEKYVPAPIYGGRKNYNQSSAFVRFPNGSKLKFGACQHEKDVMAYNGHEYVFIGIDEATECTYEIFEYLTFQNRCPVKIDVNGNPVVPCMALASNPGGPGHEWVKALFIGEKNDDGDYVRSLDNIKKKIPALKDLSEGTLNLDDYAFIPAKIFDNPVYATDKTYLEKKLGTGNAVWKEKYLYGSWETFEGAYFENFDKNRNIMDKYLVSRLIHSQPWHPRWIGVDWGFNHWTAVYWFGSATITDEEGKERDITIVYKELVVQGIGAKDLARLIAEATRWKDENDRENLTNIQTIYLSPDAFAKRDSENTIAERLGESLAAHKMPYPSAADDDRVGGARLIDEMFARRPAPDLYISAECEELIDTLPTLQVDAKDAEDVQKTTKRSDDIYDAFRYGLKSMLSSGRTPWGVERERLLTACKSNQERFFTDLSLRQRKKAAMVGIRFQKPRFSGARW
jgi:phage terminase large subunit